MKPVMMILGICVVIMLFGAVMLGIRDFRAMEYTEAFNITTGGGVTTGTATLTQDVLDDATAYISLSSNDTRDALSPTSYVAATHVLTIGGFVADATHQVTIEYRVPQLDSFYAADISSRSVPTFLILGCLGVVGVSIYVATRKD